MAISPGDRVRVKGSPVTTLPYRVVSVTDDGLFAELASGPSRFTERTAFLDVASAPKGA